MPPPFKFLSFQKRRRPLTLSKNSAALANIRKFYDEAVQMFDSTSATKVECDAKAKELKDLLAVKANILSVGKKYTTTAPYRGDGWDDDGIRLTDGKKCIFDGGEYAYSGWKEGAFITIDLGSVMEPDTYSMYLAAGIWGIALPMPNTFKIEVLASIDGINFNSLGETSLSGGIYVTDMNRKVENGMDARDYFLLKRAFFKTYEIPNPYVYIEIVTE